LLDVGRKVVEQQVSRPLSQRLLRGLLRETLTRSWLFNPAMKLGQSLRSILPPFLRAKVPVKRAAGLLPTPLQLAEHRRQVFMLVGCVQPAMMPSIDAATIRVLHRLGIRAETSQGSGCCGAIRHHLSDESGALAQARRNIDAWWPQLERSEVLLINASGCSVMVKDYGHLLRNDPAYAERARMLSEKTRDISEWLPSELLAYVNRQTNWVKVQQSIVFHPPCTLQHGQQIRGQVESLLQAFGAGRQGLTRSPRPTYRLPYESASCSTCRLHRQIASCRPISVVLAICKAVPNYPCVTGSNGSMRNGDQLKNP
jgi:glycolate oxidase iron-sulfur subunit